MRQSIKSIGHAIKSLRVDSSLSIDQLASMSGVNSAQIEAIESGKQVASISQLHAIAKALDLSLTHLIVRSNELLHEDGSD